MEMENRETQKILRTSDLGLIALLKYLGVNPIDTSVEGANKINFFFQETPEVKRIFDRFEFGLEMLVDPCMLFEAFRAVRGQIFRRMKGRENG